MARKNKKKQKNLTIISWLFIILMVSSVFGVMFYGFANSNNEIKINGFKLKQVSNYYTTEIGNENIEFYFLPEYLEDINISEQIKTELKTGASFVTFNPDDSNLEYIDLIRFELSEISNKGLTTKQFISAQTRNSTLYNLPIINCKNNTQDPIIMIKTADNTEIYKQENCIYVTASYDTDFARIRDKLLYTILGIIN